MIRFSFFFILFFPSVCFGWTLEAAKTNPVNPVLSLVFVPLHYQDRQRFGQDTEALIQRLHNTRPFDEFKNAISLWRIELSEQQERQFFKRKQGFPYLAVRKDFLDELCGRLNAPYKLIILNARSWSSSAELSEIRQTSLIIVGRTRYRDKSSLAKGFLHELGHSLGLRDEGLNSQAGMCPPGPPNCAPSRAEAEEWWGDLADKGKGVRYIRGCCGSRDYIRPTIASLMNDPDKAKDFGPVNERYLREVFIKSEVIEDKTLHGLNGLGTDSTDIR